MRRKGKINRNNRYEYFCMLSIVKKNVDHSRSSMFKSAKSILELPLEEINLGSLDSLITLLAFSIGRLLFLWITFSFLGFSYM